MIKIEKINGDNIWDVLKLSVEDAQKSFVAENSQSIIEAYIALVEGSHAFPFAIMDDDEAVGFLMVGYGAEESWEDAPDVAKDNYSLWRLMIDKNHQHKGYGRKALSLALDFIKTFPCGEAEYCWLSYNPNNLNAKALYESFGFTETGKLDGEEIILSLKL